MHAGFGGRVDSQGPLIHAGALRRSESAPFLELLLVDFARAKSAPEECRGGRGGASRRWGIILDFCVDLAHNLQRGRDPNNCREHALRCTELSHRMHGYATRGREGQSVVSRLDLPPSASAESDAQC